jgi:formylglycine-generating enzyme required for sulfatase activity
MRRRSSRALVIAGVASLAIGSGIGCQLIGGFQDFSGTGAPDGGGGAACAPPQVDGGPAMVSQVLTSGCVWIDATEVTVSEYQAFLAKAPTGQPTGCEAKDGGFDPDPACLGDAGAPAGGLPVVCVDWCDAQRYCASAGKRLCRGEPLQPATSEWRAACSDEGSRTYPYGNSPTDQTCNTSGHAAAVGSYTGCKAACGALDLTGNVKEWVDECPNGSTCLIRGGGAGDSDPTCDLQMGVPRLTVDALLGFRCCADPRAP